MSRQSNPSRCFTITTARAEQIRKAVWSAHGWAQAGRQYTKDEEAEISAFWTTLPAGTSFYDAVARMARGEHLKDEDGHRSLQQTDCSVD